MRITGGKYRGRVIQFPQAGETRPAMSRMRESLFSTISERVHGAYFLDLFSGSGLMGVEAASRGASCIHLVEKDKRKRTTILQNLEFVEEETKLFSLSVELFFSSVNVGEPYDIIYLDPPFSRPKKSELFAPLIENNLLAEGGLIILHHPRKEDLSDNEGSLTRIKMKSYGQSRLSLYTVES